MTNLHAYFHLRNVSAFRQLLDARNASGNRAPDGRPGSGPRSWSQQAQTQMTQLAQNTQLDNNPNSRDALGRTVLHLACADVAPVALEFTRALLALPSAQIDVNAQDTESGWTALHRALYAGNLPAAILLLARNDIDTGIRDLEGTTSFDVYNATVEGTAPDVSTEVSRDLLVWGSNRNATLGVGDADDRTYPEAIHVTRPTEVTERLTGSARFSPICVKHIAMSRLHTAILTNEPRGNLEVCGFGGVGRLGTKQHAQYSFTKVSGLENQTIKAIALGLDHTLALTADGNVLSWGMNRFHQLGYVIEPTDTTPGKSKADTVENQVQVSPKRIIGPLRKEEVVGIAACKTASVCWTEKDLYTWGTNTGQLGYAKGTPGWQVLPRKVAAVSKVMDVAISVMNRIQIAKVTCNDTAFAALTISGDVFLFTLPDNQTSESASSPNVRPQRVWTLRRRVAAAHDIALGADGTIIVCTASGHVFVHAPRPVKGPSISSGSGSTAGLLGGAHRTHKYQRMTGLQRVVAVAANSTAGFAALRTDTVIKPLVVEGKSLAEGVGRMQSYLAALGEADVGPERSVVNEEGDEEDEESEGIVRDVKLAERLCLVVEGGGVKVELDHHVLHGADMRVFGAVDVPVHRAVLLARCQALRGVLAGNDLSGEGLVIKHSRPTGALSISGCHALSVLVLLNYLYSDNVCAIWDRRVSIPVAGGLSEIKAKPMSIRSDMQRLAQVLDLPALRYAVETIGKRTPAPTLDADFTHLFDSAQIVGQIIVPHDISLDLADRSVLCHSVVLRACSPFFAAFFDEPEWTRNRWDDEGVICVDLKHLEWKAMWYVVRYMCCGAGVELFDDVGFVKSADELVDFVFSVMSAANELMLEQLSEICSVVILRHVTLHNCTSILANVSPLHSPKLKTRLHEYIAVNMECLLEKRLLDDVPHDTMKELATFVRAQQAIKLPRTRSGTWLARLMEKHKAWSDLQDFPPVIARTCPPGRPTKSPRLSPSSPTSPKTPRRTTSINASTPQKTSSSPTLCGGMFAMDEERAEAIPKLDLGGSGTVFASPPPASLPAPVWKGMSAMKPERLDMRSIMADEAAGSRATRSPTVRIAGVEGSTQPSLSSKMPQKDRPKQISQTATPPASASTSWRDHSGTSAQPGPHIGEPPSLLDSSVRLRLASGPSPSAVPKPTTLQPQPAKPARPAPIPVTSPAPPVFPGLGPVIVPKRSVSGAENTKRRGAPDAWTTPPSVPAPPPGLTGSVSFSAIQQQQHAQKNESGAGKAKQSLREIQEEEQRRARELQAQELARARETEELAAEFEFMQWWNAEEARVKREMEGDKGGGEGKNKRRGRGGGRRKGKGKGESSGGGENAATPVAGSTI
ncbi:hypothetical protein FRC10_006765 [Ceratobasidium sp. 414]|nr:hypothetical protein FRC10_006765 [Ceratobasidium sp. 414]